jgi:glycerophosphoryl diester phosphodiesterase
MNFPLITAHAGCMNTEPNTIFSVLKGIKAGADIIEVDVRATKDGVAILRHDPEIYTSDCRIQRVDQVTFQEIVNFDENQMIVTVEEVLDLVLKHNKTLNLDMKDINSIDPTMKIVKEKKMKDHVIFSGCDKEKAFYIHKNYPGFRVLFNVDESLFDFKNYDYRSAIQKTCHDAMNMSCCGINIEYKHCKKELIEYAHARFLPVAIWTVDKREEMETYTEMKVYSITTNKVKALVELKQNKQ